MEIKDLYKSLKNKTKKIAIVGLGYVGFPVMPWTWVMQISLLLLYLPL